MAAVRRRCNLSDVVSSLRNSTNTSCFAIFSRTLLPVENAEELCEAFRKLGIIVVEGVPDFVQNHPQVMHRVGPGVSFPKRMKMILVCGFRVIKMFFFPLCGFLQISLQKDYLHPATANGVLAAVHEVQRDLGTSMAMFDKMASELERRLLRTFLGNENISPKYKDTIWTLPVFKTLDNSGFQPSYFTSLKSTPRVAKLEQVRVKK